MYSHARVAGSLAGIRAAIPWACRMHYAGACESQLHVLYTSARPATDWRVAGTCERELLLQKEITL